MRLVARTVRLVLGLPRYTAVALVTAILALSGFVLSQNVPLVRDTVFGGPLPIEARLTILAQQYPFVGTSYGPLAGLMLVAVAVLVGVDVAVVAYHFREHGLSLRDGGAGGAGGTVGVLLGALGAGCAACGSAVLVGLLSLGGGSGLLLFLPFEGVEFTLLALVPLSLSLFWLAEGLRGGEIRGCPVEVPE